MNGLMLYRQYLENIRECISNYELEELESKKYLDIISRVSDIEDLSYIDVILKNAGLNLSFISDREFLDKEVILKSKLTEVVHYEDVEDEEMQTALSDYLNTFVSDEDSILEKISKIDEIFGEGDIDSSVFPQSKESIMGTAELLEKHKDTLNSLFGTLSSFTKSQETENEEDLDELEEYTEEEGIGDLDGEDTILENGESDEYAVTKEEFDGIEEIEGFRESEKVTIYDTGVIAVDMSDEFDDEEDLDLFEDKETEEIDKVKYMDLDDSLNSFEDLDEIVTKEGFEEKEDIESKEFDLDTSFLEDDESQDEEYNSENNLEDIVVEVIDSEDSIDFLEDEPEYISMSELDESDIKNYSLKDEDNGLYLDDDEGVKEDSSFNTDFLNDDDDNDNGNIFEDEEESDEMLGKSIVSMSSEDLENEISNMYSLNEIEDTEPKEGNPFKEATDYFLNGGKKIKKEKSEDLRKIYKSKEKIVDVEGIGGTEDAVAKMILAAGDGIMNLPNLFGKFRTNSKKLYDKMVVEEDEDEE